MTERLAYIFPGQGSQYPGMGSELADAFPAASEIFERADCVLDFAISAVCFSGTKDQLQLTTNTQPAILTVSVAAMLSMEAASFPKPDYVAGHSLGEYSALVAAGSLSFEDAVRTVRARGAYMQEAVPVGAGAMAAVIGSDLRTVMEACNEAQQGEVCVPANINSPGQVVIAGHEGAVDRAIEVLKGLGARRVVKLDVSAPFHCALMMPAQERLETDLNKLEFASLAFPLVTNVDASEITKAEDARQALVRQVSSAVRWQESIEYLISRGVRTFVEVGPGKVLCGLVRQIDRTVICLSVEDAKSLESTRQALKESYN